MTARDILQDARDSLLYCMELTERLECYRTIAERAQRRGYADAVIEVVDRGRDLQEELSIMHQRADKANALISLLADPTQQTVLRLVYLDGCSWQQIAQKMHYTLRWTHSLHKSAIEELERRCG